MKRNSLLPVTGGAIFILLSLMLLTGCGGPADSDEARFDSPMELGGMIDLNHVFVHVPLRNQVAVVDPGNGVVVRKIDVGQYSVDHEVAPNGLVYIPLYGDAEQGEGEDEGDGYGDDTSSVAVIDRKRGQLSYISSPYGGLSHITISKYGIAYITAGTAGTGDVDGPGKVVLLDTMKNQFLGAIDVPGPVSSLTLFDDRRALASVVLGNDRGPKGVYLLDSGNRQANWLELGEREPRGPDSLYFDRERQLLYTLYSGIPLSMRSEHIGYEEPLLNAHVSLWQVSNGQLVQRHRLALMNARTLAVDGQGRMYVGHESLDHEEVRIHQISVIQPSGQTELVRTLENPQYVKVVGDQLMVASGTAKQIELLPLDKLSERRAFRLDGTGSF